MILAISCFNYTRVLSVRFVFITLQSACELFIPEIMLEGTIDTWNIFVDFWTDFVSFLLTGAKWLCISHKFSDGKTERTEKRKRKKRSNEEELMSFVHLLSACNFYVRYAQNLYSKKKKEKKKRGLSRLFLCLCVKESSFFVFSSVLNFNCHFQELIQCQQILKREKNGSV